MDFWSVFFTIDIILFVLVSLTVFYIFVFSVASLFNRRQDIPRAKRENRFIVLIPAYKRDDVILQTVKSVLGQTYPQRMFDVTVISDHQSEMTNMHLAQFPITLLTPNFEKSAKTKSLQYALMNLPEFKIYDIVLILNADNIVEPEFIEQMNAAFEVAGTKAIQAHRLSRNRDTAMARLDAIFEEINNSIFRRGHITLGLSSALSSSGTAYDFTWFKNNIMKARSVSEEKELEAQLMHQHVFIDYFDDILVYDEKKRHREEFNQQRGRWASAQFHSLLSNIKFLPRAIMNRNYDEIDKILQWMLIPRTTLMGIILIMSIVVPFIYFTAVIKWWCVAALIMFAFSLATPNYLVDKQWDTTFLRAPVVIFWGIVNSLKIWRRSS